MAMKPCKECGRQVSTKADYCPQCGVKDPGRGGLRDKLKASHIVVITIGVLAIIGVASAGPGGDPPPPPPPPPPHSELVAYTMCQQFAEDRLRSPSTADWVGGYSRQTTHEGNGRYRVVAQVDAQNGFGATVRSDVNCTVQWTGGDQWRLESLSIE